MNLQPSTGKIKLCGIDKTEECQPSNEINPPVFQKIRDKTPTKIGYWLVPAFQPSTKMALKSMKIFRDIDILFRQINLSPRSGTVGNTEQHHPSPGCCIQPLNKMYVSLS